MDFYKEEMMCPSSILEIGNFKSYFEMVGQEVFQEHSNNFKSTLDKIKSVKEPSIDPKLDQYIRFTLKTLMIFLMKKLKNLENTTLI